VLDGRDLVLVHALAPTTPALLEPGPSSAAESHALSLRNRGRDLLAGAAEVVAARAPRLARSTHFRLADPRTTLIDLSAAAHLVVVGSRGRGLPSRGRASRNGGTSRAGRPMRPRTVSSKCHRS
jgi:nucleotide-binding universal stress UspA family protein